MEQPSPPSAISEMLSLPTPRPHSEYRRFKSSDERLYYFACDQLEANANQLNIVAERSTFETFMQYSDELLTSSHQLLNSTIDQLETSNDPNLDLGYRRRIDLYRCLLPQILLLPGVFKFSNDNPRANELREYLIDREGIYGLVVQHLADSLDLFYEKGVSDRDKGLLVGDINESTACALLNRSQAADWVALPALIDKDIYGRIDIHCYTLTDDSLAQGDLQIKSSPIARKRIHNIRTLNGADLGNSYHNPFWYTPGRLKTARALVREVNGLTNHKTKYTLARIENHVTTIARREITAAPSPLKKIA